MLSQTKTASVIDAALIYKVRGSVCLLGALLLLTLVGEHDHKHVYCEPEGCRNRHCGEAGLSLCPEWIGREGEWHQCDGHVNEHADGQNHTESDLSFG